MAENENQREDATGRVLYPWEVDPADHVVAVEVDEDAAPPAQVATTPAPPEPDEDEDLEDDDEDDEDL